MLLLIQNMIMSTLVETTKCLFCDGHIPANYDQVYINHMNDHHRAFVNIEFLFQISLLGVDDLDSYVNRDSKMGSIFTETQSKDQSISDIIDKSNLIQNVVSDSDTVTNDSENKTLDDEDVIKIEPSYEENEEEKETKETSIKNGNTMVKSNSNDSTMKKGNVSAGSNDETESNHLKPLEVVRNENCFEDKKEKKDAIETVDTEKKVKKRKFKGGKARGVKSVCNCDIKIEGKIARIRHNKIVHKNWFSCDHCKTGVFRKEEDLMTHLKEIHPNGPKYKSNICDECGFVANHWYQMGAHKAEKHDYSVQQCHVCAASIQGKRKLQRHLYRHTLKFTPKQCPECNKFVKNIERHKKKMHMISELMPFECEICEKRFAYEFDLKNHIVIHSDLKPYICRYGCGFGSKTAGNRRKHEVNKHNAELEKDTKKL